MQNHILPAGWHNWNNPDNEETAFYAEYMTHGVDVTERVSWSRQLTEIEAEEYIIENIFDGTDGPWMPNSEPDKPNSSTKLHGFRYLYLIALLTVMYLKL